LRSAAGCWVRLLASKTDKDKNKNNDDGCGKRRCTAALATALG
jgi:hypothetical protein